MAKKFIPIVGMLALIALLLSGLPAQRAEASPDWWDTDWQYRQKLTFDNSGQSENLVNFPVLVKLTPGRIDYSKTQDSGEDIRFVDSDDVTELSYEIEEWDETGDSWVWVKVPQIDGSSNTDYIYMYYGNPSALDGQNPTAVWDENFMMVQHLNDETTSTVEDSTVNNNDGIKPFTPSDVAITSCEDTVDWTGTSLSSDTDKKEGNYSLKDTIASPVVGTNYDTTYNPTGTWNLGARQIDFWWKCNRASTVFTSTEILISDGVASQTTSIGTYSANTWIRIQITIDTAILDESAITSITFRTKAKATTAFYKLIDIVYANGSSVEADGKIGKGQEFDAGNDLIRVPDSPASLDGTNAAGTFELWINWVQAARTTDNQLIMASSNRYSGPDGYEWSTQNTTGALFFYPWGGNGNNYNLGPNPAINGQWAHLVVTLEDTGLREVKIYVDTVSITFTYNGVPTLWTTLALPADWLWGGNPDRPGRYFGGMFDEIRVSDIVRSTDWIEAQYLSMTDNFITYGSPTQRPRAGGSSDSGGDTKKEYRTNEDVWVTASGFLSGSDVDVYVVEDTAWIDGDSIPSDVGDGMDTIQADGEGNIVRELIWSVPLEVGKYDVVFDADRNGYYDEVSDLVDDPHDPGFTVVSSTVGGEVYPIDKAALLMPWLSLVLLLALVGAYVARSTFSKLKGSN